jgi:pyruvate, water dikinase
VDDSGRSVPAFVVTITDAEGDVRSYSCGLGAPSASEASCGNDGLTLSVVTGDVTATVKSHGYASWNGELRPERARAAEAGRVVEIPISALAAFEHTEDYDTGYEPEGGLALFERAAVAESTELGPTQVVKFYIADVQTTPKVYFQNTRKHPLHYEFARGVLQIPGTVEDFEASTYYGTERTGMGGSILYRPAVRTTSAALGAMLDAPVSVTFFPSDDLTPEQALLAHRLLEERMGFASLQGGSLRVVYEPAGSEQETELARAKGSFEQWGSLWLTLSEIYGGLSLQVLNPGLAYGTLRRMTPEDLESAVVSARDVLLLTRLPTELPIVAGTITEEMQTPLAHVNVAARTRGTPNIALKNASGDARVKDHIGKLVRFEVKNGTFSLSDATQEEAEQYWAGLARTPYVPLYDDTSSGLPGFDSVGFADAVRIGVKAANLAELWQLLGDQAPTGFAVPFYYYDQFMRGSPVTGSLCDAALEDCANEGRPEPACDGADTLCRASANGEESFFDFVGSVLGDDSFLTDSQIREATLDELRYMIRHTPVSSEFAGLLDSRVTDQFGEAKIRIRSSTNSEDLEDFSGAGLYDSVSANTPDQGPASAEIRKVWASVWNWRAFEERSFWSIDHLSVRMGCAVTRAFSDEAANGVLITQNIAEPTTAGMYVNVQLGETSVTNPSDGSLPEAFSIVPAPDGVQALRQRFSSLSPEMAILSDGEIAELYAVAYRIQDHFAELYDQDPYSLALDIEFKFNQPDRSLVIKQVRPYTGG